MGKPSKEVEIEIHPKYIQNAKAKIRECSI